MERVCLLITTLDRSDLLRKSLSRLVNKTQPDEVVVVDDGGTDDCQAVCDQFGARYVYTHNPGATICSHARNVGIKATDCDLVVTSEPEIIFNTDVIAQMLLSREEHPHDVVSAGTIHHRQADNTVQTITGWVAPFAAMYKRSWLMDVGGWDESFASPWGWEDTDLLTRLREAGHGQVISLPIEVTHQYHPSRACDQALNQAHFLAKQYPHDIIANREVPWGITKHSS